MGYYNGNQNKYCIAFRIMAILVFIGYVSIAQASVFKTGIYPGNSFIDPTVFIDLENFRIGEESYIAPFTSFTGEKVHIGDFSNVQDSGSNSGKIRIGNDAVVAHGADLMGDVKIGNNAFIGFNSVIRNSKIGDGAYIGIGSRISGVDIPAHKSVPPGSIIDSKDDIKNLEPVTLDQKIFVNEVVEVNRVLAIGYGQLFMKSGLEAFGPVGPNGDGDILIDGKDILSRSGSQVPVIGKGSVIESPRIIGNVFIGENSRVKNGTSMRGDEGVPIKIGRNARIGKNNTFHSLDGKEINIGDNFRVESESVIHGPLVIGNNVRVGKSAVVFRSTIGNNVAIGDNAIVVDVKLPDGIKIPSGSIITKPTMILGTSFNDRNSNGIQETGEQGLANWEIRLTGFDTISGNSVNEVATTDLNGRYSFTGLTPGSYTVSQTLQLTWVSTTSLSSAVTLLPTQDSEVNFGNKKIRQ